MVVCESSINNIMGGIENTGGVTLHNHRRKLKQRFDIIKKLGQGTYGKVQLGINKETGQEVAIKTIKKCKIETEADLIRIRREIQIMSSVQHPNIIHIYEVFENREKMVLVMEYAAGGELYDYLSERKVLSEDEARRIFRQIATAVYYCHKHKICHRDLKLENILLDENGSAKIADFGLSNVFDERRLLSTFCGSPLYASPEIVKGTPYHGPEVDCWSLGVLLYTLVYGAMPFDGSNFKRLVKQISQGDYFEPKKPSSASPLIREMLTVVPEKRANIEKICSHWWVNASYPDSCLDIAEELANQTPVRLDLLLSLAPPPPQVGSDKLVVTGESSSIVPPIPEQVAPARSQSVGSLMDLVPPAERRIRDLVSDDNKQSPKRKLEVTVSTENANLSNSGAKRKERISKKEKDTIMEPGIANKIDDTVQSMNEQPQQPVDASLTRNLTQTLPKPQELEHTVADVNIEDSAMTDPNLQGAACTELIEESKKNEIKEKKKTVKLKKTKLDKPSLAAEERKSIEIENKINDKENIETNNIIEADGDKKEETKIPVKRKIIKKKIEKPSDEIKTETKLEKPVEKQETKTTESASAEANSTPSEDKNEEAQPPTKPVERRRSKIFETAEKFQNLLASNEGKSSVLEKPKKIFIPGVNVGGFKKEFERKASLTSSAIPDLKKTFSKKTVASPATTTPSPESPPSTNNKVEEPPPAKSDETVPNELPKPAEVTPKESQLIEQKEVENEPGKETDQQKIRLKNAVNVISNAISKEGARKSKSRPIMRKPPVPFGMTGRSASGSIGMSPMYAAKSVEQPENAESPDDGSMKSSCEITLKSATLPRRKMTKAEIKLDYPPPKPATMEFKTEMAHRIEGQPDLKSQRSEIIVPVSSTSNVRVRSTSLDPEIKPKDSPKERIIPISFEREDSTETKSEISSPQAKPPMPKLFQAQKSVPSTPRFGSLSRQSTHDSDSEALVSENLEPIRKSPREYIIPIAVEGGGYVTPRATSLEPSETGSGITSTGRRAIPKFSRPKRMGSLLSDREGSEDELSFSSLHRHNSVGRDSDNEDSRREPFHMHRLRSSRPTRKPNLEHADSLSSGEEDDDDGFELLTAENLFSTLLSRVRSLTQRLNVEDNGRLGFPSTRLLGNFDHGSKLWNLYGNNDPLSRFSPIERAFHREQSNSSNTSSTSGRAGAPWRRSVSRDLASDIERVFNEPPKATSTLPRDKSKKQKGINLSNLNIADLKLSDADALALSYLTPGLSRRIQTQLLTQLPSRSRKVSRHSSINEEVEESVDKNKENPTENVFSDSSDSEAIAERFKRNERIQNNINNFNLNKLNNNFSVPESEEHCTPHAEVSTPQNSRFINNNLETKSPENMQKKLDSVEADKIENYSKYKPYRHCFRSTSLMEPTTDSYRNPLYYRNVNYSSEGFNSPYNHEKSTTSYTSSPTCLKYDSTIPHITTMRDIENLKHQDDYQDTLTGTRVSRYLRPDFYDNCVYSKERKKREIETQKVLKEIRNKRNSSSSRSTDSKKKETENKITSNKNESQSEDKSLSSDVSASLSLDNSAIDDNKNNNKNIELEDKRIKKESKISKLIRPKSYPTDYSNVRSSPESVKCDKFTKSKIFKQSLSTDKTREASPKDGNAADKKRTNNQFLNSIEKKIRSFYSETDDNKVQNENNSRIKNTIRSLREQSEPRNMEHCVTESGLIKRAVSVEDFSVFGTKKQESKPIQTSRKSVSKILGLFKKYEDKEKSTSKIKTVNTADSNVTKKSSAVKTNSDSKNMKVKNSSDAKRSKESTVKYVKSSDNADQNSAISNNSESKINNDAYDQVLKKYNSKIKTSKLPTTSRIPSIDFDSSSERRTSNISTSDKKQNAWGALSLQDGNKLNRKGLKLDLKNPLTDLKVRENCDIQTDDSSRDETSILFSPCDESNDSWSMCSDHHRQDLSPNSDNKIYSEEETNESVSDRIRRKSFYCRFNEKKKPRKSSLVSTGFDYKDFELKYADKPTSNSTKSRKSKEYTNDMNLTNKSLTNSHTLQSPSKKTAKHRTYSLNENFYTYNTGRYREPTSNVNVRPYLASDAKEKSAPESKSFIAKPIRTSLQAPSSRIQKRFSMSPPPSPNEPTDSPSPSYRSSDMSSPLMKSKK